MSPDRQRMRIHGLTDGDLARFTEGDCHYLARAIHKRTGWPIHAFVHEDSGPDLHAFVVMPDGRALDVHGAQSIGGFCQHWADEGTEHKAFSWCDFRRHEWPKPEFGRYTYRRAHLVAQKLLAEVS